MQSGLLFFPCALFHAAERPPLVSVLIIHRHGRCGHSRVRDAFNLQHVARLDYPQVVQTRGFAPIRVRFVFVCVHTVLEFAWSLNSLLCGHCRFILAQDDSEARGEDPYAANRDAPGREQVGSYVHAARVLAGGARVESAREQGDARISAVANHGSFESNRRANGLATRPHCRVLRPIQV
jgi:hypothetical protein